MARCRCFGSTAGSAKPYDPNSGGGLGRFGLGGFGGNLLIAALFDGRIDAFYVKGIEGVTLANAIGASLVSEFGAHPDPWVRLGAGNPRPLTIGAEFLTVRPDLVGVLLRTIKGIAPWAARHRDEAVRALALDHKASEAAVTAALGDDIGAHVGITLEAGELALFDRYEALLEEWKIIENHVPQAEWAAPRPLAAITGA